MGSTRNLNWINYLCSDVQQGQFSAGLTEENFNDVLKWLLEREFIVGQQISHVFSQHYKSDVKARETVFLALDDFLFLLSNDNPHEILGLSIHADSDAVKIRYRRLIQIYHPDRSLTQVFGLMHRAEKLNLAFDEIKSHNSSLDRHVSDVAFGNTFQHASSNLPEEEYNTQYQARAIDKVRASMSSPQQVKYSLLSALVVGAFIILVMIYKNNGPIDYVGVGASIEDGMNNGLPSDKEVPMGLQKPTKKMANVGDDNPSFEKTDLKVIARPKQINQLDTKYTILENQNKGLTDKKKSTGQSQKLIINQAQNALSDLKRSNTEKLIQDQPFPLNTKTSLLPEKNDVYTKVLPFKAVIQKSATEVEDNPRQVKVFKQNINQKIIENSQGSNENNNELVQNGIVPATSQIIDALVDKEKNKEVSEEEREQVEKILKAYIKGMRKGNVNLSLQYVEKIVRVDGVATTKAQLRNIYGDWFRKSIDRKYQLYVHNMVKHDGFIRVSCRANINFKYIVKPSKAYRGEIYYDLTNNVDGGKIIAINTR